jgi:dTDP-4-dehydrorhamnose 3,5-epimerase
VKRTDLALPGVCLVEPVVHGDERGHFFESWRRDKFAAIGIDVPFVQDNQALSSRGVLRGLHWQVGKVQAKLLRVLDGEVFDVAVDVRRGSPTFGRWAGETLSAANRRMMFVPAGFAHGYLVLSERATVFYKCSEPYSPADERGFAWNDPAVGIRWPLSGPPVLSARDAKSPLLSALAPSDLL